jgi:ribonuclease P protein component
MTTDSSESPEPAPTLTPAPTGPPATYRPHERVRGRTDFQRVFQRRRSASDAAMVVHAVENGREHARLGISVGRKKVRRATARNRVKRLIREVFRLTKARWPTGVDYVVVPRTGNLNFAQVMEALPILAAAAARRLGPARARSGDGP